MCNQKSLETSTNKHHLETENAIIENIAELTSSLMKEIITRITIQMQIVTI